MEAVYRTAPKLLNDPRHTVWCNLGYWEHDTHYAGAAAALAKRVADAANLKPGHALLDIGVGDGEQLELWLQDYAPSAITAVELSLAKAAAVRARHSAEPRVRVVCADAAALPPDVAPGFDAVLCLDCAYHFRTRAAFLRSSARLLRAGGRFAAFDLVAAPCSPCSLHFVAQRLIALASSIPLGNLWSVERYGAELERAGYEQIELDDVSLHVFGPLSEYARQRARSIMDPGSEREPADSLPRRVGWWVMLRLLCLYFGVLSRFGLFRCFVVSATRAA